MATFLGVSTDLEQRWMVLYLKATFLGVSTDLKDSIIVSIGAFISNVFKSNQSAAGLKALKPAANGRYLCKSLDYFHLLYRSTFILSAKCTLGLLVFP